MVVFRYKGENKMTNSQELIQIETIKPLDLFKPGGADVLLSEIKERVKSIVLDASTVKGRDEIRTIAAKIAKSKIALDGMGKELKAEWKARCDAIDSERRKIFDQLEALQHEVRQPLTDFENAVKERIDNHEKDLIVLANWKNLGDYGTSKQAEENLVALDGFYKSKDWEEFKNRADAIFEETKGSLIASAHNLKKQEEERIEFERLRREDEARKQKEREEQIAKDAAERATREATEKAEREKQELEMRAKRAEEAAENAAKAERERIELQAKREAMEQARREADIEHRRVINNTAVAALSLSVPELDVEVCKKIIQSIIKGDIPNVKINY